jgi:hypothetical protein
MPITESPDHYNFCAGAPRLYAEKNGPTMGELAARKNMSTSQTITAEQQQTINRINEMSHFDMCSLWRFAPAGHPYFDSMLPFAEVFKARLFGHFGGFTPQISKALS